MVEFKYISIKNFLSIEDITLQFTKGITFVRGINLDDTKSTSNGSGKSSLFDAVMWALYGETSRGKTADSIVNRQSGGDTSVELNFDSNTENYTIIRYRKHSIFEDSIKIFSDGKDVSLKRMKENQNFIFRLLGISKDLFDSTIFLTQGFNSRFSLLTETERRLLLEKIRNVEVWDKAREIASKKDLTITKELTQLQSKIKIYSEENIPSLENDIQNNKILIQEYSVKLQELKPDLSRVQGLSEALTEYQSQKNLFSKKKENINEHLQSNKKLLLDLEPKRNKDKKQFDTIQQSFQNIEYELKYIPNGECKICGKNTQDFYKDKINDLTLKLEELQVQRTQIQSLVQEQEEQYQELNNFIQNLYQKNSLIDSTITTLITSEEATKRQIQEIESTYERNRQLILQKLETSESSIEDLSLKIKNLKKVISELENSSTILSKNSLIYKELDKIFSPRGIRSYIIAQDIEALNSSLEEYSQFLFSNAVARLIFKGETLESSKISIELEDSMGNIFDYTDCSGGQSRRIDILIQLSIRDLIFNISNLNANILVLDEIFDSLDREGILNVLSLVRENYKDFCVYIISHIPDLPYEYFDNQINLTKINGITELS